MKPLFSGWVNVFERLHRHKPGYGYAGIDIERKALKGHEKVFVEIYPVRPERGAKD